MSSYSYLFKYIIIGDTLLGGKYYEFGKEHIYYQQDFDELINNYKSMKHKKTPVKNYIKYLEANKKLYSGYKHCTLDEIVSFS
jgi:hypothetical protein